MLNSIKTAINALNKNKGRTILTILGIVIGITAVITVMSAGQAIKGLIVGQVEAFGSNYIEIEVKTPQTSQTSMDNAFSMVGGAIITTLKEKDADAVLRHPNIDKIYAGVMGQEIASFQNEFKLAQIFGASEQFIEIDSSEIDYGRFYTRQEDLGMAKVVVLGSKLKERLFHENEALGQSIKIGSDKYRVIGVLKERGATFGFDMDSLIFMPLRTLQKRIAGIDYVSFIIGQMVDNDLGDQTAEDVTLIMRQQHNITDPNKDDFAVVTMDQAMEMIDIVIYGMQILLIALGSISLIVGGVGIMNIMYVSVTERTYEIGLRKSVGAKRKDILWQFLAEAVIITLIGGLIGIVIGTSLSGLISVIAQSQGLDWTFAISWSGLIIAVFMSVLVGLFFGLYPAKQAAKKSPIDALRHE